MISCRVGLIIGGPDGRRSFSCSSIARALFFFISRHMPVKFCVIDRPGSVASVVRSERERQQTVADGNTTVVSISTALCTVTHALQQSKCKHTEYITHKLLNTTQPAYLYDNLSPPPRRLAVFVQGFFIYHCSSQGRLQGGSGRNLRPVWLRGKNSTLKGGRIPPTLVGHT